MDRKELLKIVGVLVIIVLVANVVLFAMRIITELVFWIIIILGAIYAFKVMPRLKGN